ncbi:hypothetical protein M569_16577, partial [Genlisea aurea]
VDAIGTSIGRLSDIFVVGNRGGDTWNNGGYNLALTAVAGLAVAAVVIYASRFRHKSPWPRRKRKNILLRHQWESLFSPDGKLRDGVQFLKKVRSGGVDPNIRSEVWPFLLGVYDFTSTKEERDAIISQKRKEYEMLRRQCDEIEKSNRSDESSSGLDGRSIPFDADLTVSKDVVNPEDDAEDLPTRSVVVDGRDDGSKQTADLNVANDSNSPETDDSSDDPDRSRSFTLTGIAESSDPDPALNEDAAASSPFGTDVKAKPRSREDFCTWQRIIRLDAVRANGEWMEYSPSQNAVSDSEAFRAAEAVGLKDYEHLEPARILHASRLVSILEAYALHDPKIGYCQGMSDLLSPIIVVLGDDGEAFWCFVGFMKKARDNFRLDEVGIRRQLSIVSTIIRHRDSHLYKHLEKLQAHDCFFVYRMVVVLFRRELSFEQTLCLWEVMWADQAAVRAGIIIGKSSSSPWSKARRGMTVPPTDDLLLYAIAASVLQRRKQIIEKYSSMDEILRECLGMAGRLDVWNLLDDAHNLVVMLHHKI